jgi:hypothetical protein
MTDLLTRLEALLAEVNSKIESETDPARKIYWQGVQFGLETAIEEAQRAQRVTPNSIALAS